jgi:hypothetical protein
MNPLARQSTIHCQPADPSRAADARSAATSPDAFCASDVFAVGGSGTIQHYDGSSWSAVTIPKFNSCLSDV